MTPIIKVLKVDETEYWSLDIRRRAPRLFGVYLFNSSERTHLCELTPSYYCEFVETQYSEVSGLSDSEQDDLNQEILEGDALSNDNRYYHCSELDGIPEIAPGSFPSGKMGVYVFDDGTSSAAQEVARGEETSDELMSACLEYGRGNSL